MKIEGLDRILGAHRLFRDLDADFIALVAGCAANRVFAPATRLARQGEAMDRIYLIRAGHVAMEFHAAGRGRLRVQTVGPDEVLGLSWLVPPCKWATDAQTLDEVRAIEIDADCLRRKCEADPAVGYAVLKRFMTPIVERLHAARLQMLDVYGSAR